VSSGLPIFCNLAETKGMTLFFHLGRYLILMTRVFAKPDRHKEFFKQVSTEIDNIGLDSLGIVVFISMFMGAVLVIQTAYNIDSPLVPLYTIGFTTRQSIVLEFSPTIISIILAGKVGSRISSEIGTMRVTEQIDALDVMGINSANFLILPKIVAAVIINPFLIVISMFVGLMGGWLIAIFGDAVSGEIYIYGIRSWFIPFEVFYALLKTTVFAFIITSVSAYNGYYVEGGALDVGKASTRTVVHSSILIIIFNLILTQLLLG
jgi:phospholipid/cholesterol/gamma-HCH transport system permease protein